MYTTFNSISINLILLTNKNVALIYSVTICERKTKDCSPSGPFREPPSIISSTVVFIFDACRPSLPIFFTNYGQYGVSRRKLFHENSGTCCFTVLMKVLLLHNRGSNNFVWVVLWAQSYTVLWTWISRHSSSLLGGEGRKWRKSAAKCGEEGKLATCRQHYTTGVKG